jgi:hypothetical protein
MELPLLSGADVRVSCNGNFRIVSGWEHSSTKEDLSCDVRVPEPSWLVRLRLLDDFQSEACGNNDNRNIQRIGRTGPLFFLRRRK